MLMLFESEIVDLLQRLYLLLSIPYFSQHQADSSDWLTKKKKKIRKYIKSGCLRQKYMQQQITCCYMYYTEYRYIFSQPKKKNRNRRRRRHKSLSLYY